MKEFPRVWSIDGLAFAFAVLSAVAMLVAIVPPDRISFGAVRISNSQVSVISLVLCISFAICAMGTLSRVNRVRVGIILFCFVFLFADLVFASHLVKLYFDPRAIVPIHTLQVRAIIALAGGLITGILLAYLRSRTVVGAFRGTDSIDATSESHTIEILKRFAAFVQGVERSQVKTSSSNEQRRFYQEEIREVARKRNLCFLIGFLLTVSGVLKAIEVFSIGFIPATASILIGVVALTIGMLLALKVLFMPPIS